MKNLIRLFVAAVTKAPALLVAGMLALTVGFGYLSTTADRSTGQEGFAPDNPEIDASNAIGELFGENSTETVMQVIVRSEDGDVLTAKTMQTVGAALAALQESAGAGALSVRPDRPQPFFSFLAPVDFTVQAQGIPMEALDDAAIKQIYADTLASPEGAAQLGFASQLVADKDQNGVPEAGLILVFVEVGDDIDAQIEAEQAIADALSSVSGNGIEIRPFSFSLLFGEDSGFEAEIGRLFGLAFLIIIVILMFVYWINPRSGWGTAVRRSSADMGVTMLTIVMAITWMNGIAALLQDINVIGSLSEIAQIVPVLLIGLGVDYGIHLTSRYREEIGGGLGVQSAIERAIKTSGVALALATLTTAIGFLTNITNPVPALKDFGILAAVGIVASFVLMLTFVPSLRLILDRRAEAGGRLPAESMGASSGERLLPKIMEKTAVLAERLPVPTLVVTLALGVLGFYGLTQLETKFSFTDFLPEDSEVVATFNILQEEFGGGFGETTQVLVQAPEGGNLATPEVWTGIAQFQTDVADVDSVIVFPTPQGDVASVSSPVAVIQQFLAPPAPGQPALDPSIIDQMLALGLQPDGSVAPDADVAGLWTLAASISPDQMGRVVSEGPGGEVQAVLLEIGTQAGEQGAAALRDDLKVELASFDSIEGATAIATSQSIITAVVIQALSDSQVNSLLWTVIAATIVLMINFWFENRRPFLGVLTMIPVVLVVLWTFGLMFVSGIPFGPVTATLSALAVGIGVPYTIHLARRFEEDRQRYDSVDEAIRSTTRHTGGALAGSAFTTAAGFGILTTSTLKPFQQMGQVTAYAIGLSLIGAILVLPSLLVLWERWHQKRDQVPA